MSDLKGRITEGTILMGNTNQCYVIVKRITNGVAFYQDFRTGTVHNLGLATLERCNLSIIGQEETR